MNPPDGPGLSQQALPSMIPVRQRFAVPRLDDIEAAMHEALEQLDLKSKIRPGMRVAVPAGSRGIAGIPLLLRTAVRYLRGLGAEPVVLAAMGSHGGGTAEGQLAVLESLGITREAVEAEVLGGVETIQLGVTSSGYPIFFDAVAARCDGILVINRVKVHTAFHGPLESGLTKMLVVGLGKPAGAAQFHSLGPGALASTLEEAGQVILDRMPVLGGVAILENSREETAELVPVPPDGMIEQEKTLLPRARALFPRLPVERLDVLVVEEMGKNISGTGMDTNVIGRMAIRGVPEGLPEIGCIAVLDLTEASHGNAHGMGLADLITARFREKIDFHASYLNSLTTTFVQRSRMPLTLPSDRDVIEAALRMFAPSPEEARVIRIQNTLMLEELWVSPAVWREISGHPGTVAVGAPEPWRFDGAGNLARPWS